MDNQYFSKLYSALQLPDDADFVQLRKQYRRLAQRLHPDSPQGDAEAFQRVASAYDILRRYHDSHGHLPLLPPPASAPTLAPGEGIRRRPANHTPFWNRRRITAVILPGLIALGWWLWPDPPHTPEPSETVAQPPPTQTLPALRPVRPTFSVGDSLTRVVDAQGAPDRRDGDTWFYGASRVYFHEGKVTGWEERPDSPLHLSRRSMADPVTATFTVGDSPEQVLRAQGSPQFASDREWQYGLSSVFFDQGKVIGWHNDPLNPLAVKKR